MQSVTCEVRPKTNKSRKEFHRLDSTQNKSKNQIEKPINFVLI